MSSPTHSNDAQDISFTSLTDGSPVNCVTTRRTRVDTEGGLNPLLLREFKESMVNKMDKWFARQENMISKVVKEFNEVKQTMNQMSNYFDELNNKTTECLNRLAETEKKVKSLEEHTKTITQLEAKIESMEQHSRQCNVEIQNVPERRNENLIKIVEHIGTSIKQSISPNDIVSVHRVPHADTKSTHPKSIVVKLCSRILRDNILSAARMKKGLYTDDLHINGENRRVYVNEHLTLRNKQLFRSARETAKRCNFRFTWIKHGNILVRECETSRVIAIRSYEDLSKIKSSKSSYRYIVFRCDRDRTATGREEGGGVLVAVRRELRPVRRALPGPVPPIVDCVSVEVPSASREYGREETCNGVTGRCVSIKSCSPFVLMMKTEPISQYRTLLKESHCGFEGNDPMVCCPESTPKSSSSRGLVPPIDVRSKGSARMMNLQSPILSPPTCGVSNATSGRVVGGVNARHGDLPWMGILGYWERSDQRGSNRKIEWRCGGSLVSSRHVLTAAHCIHRKENYLHLVRLGELDLDRDDEADAIDVLIQKAVKHEEYDINTFTNDIGLLVLVTEVEFTGGNTSSHLKVTQLQVVDNRKCKKSYLKYPVMIDDKVLCAEAWGRDSCKGDSGGPLIQPFYNQEKKVYYFYQIGVIAYGRYCADAGYPGVYSRVTYYMPWIQRQIMEN
ncbi:unnamed protein product [Danaus chrysippus]|uniref:(African queen) hypothetical protein n=1 Tax=Danaus chrysippus TaxID=151541 RepID=A0A8J2QZF6_9NEOP|nr:unnamed protein product [Danaus chrysippus]